MHFVCRRAKLMNESSILGQRLIACIKSSRACYFFHHGGCQKSAADCLAQNGRKHEQLPKNLLQYLRKPGARASARSSSREPRKTEPTRWPSAQRPTRWMTDYCWKHADKPGSCPKGDDCPREHITEAEAKAAANGKHFGTIHTKGVPRAKTPAYVIRPSNERITEIAEVTEESTESRT